MVAQVTDSRPSLGHVEDLRAFCAVVDSGSLTAAGRLLGETKAAVSRRIARLERRSGLALFDRHPRAVVVTARGRALRHRLAPALELLDGALASVREPEVTPSLRVTAPPDLGTALVTPMLAAFLREAPATQVSLTLTDRVLSFEAHGVDVAFRVARKLRDSSLVGHRVAPLEASFFASPAYLEQHSAPRHLDGLDRHRLLLMPGHEKRLVVVDRRLPTKRISIAVRPLAVADVSALLAFALAGLGIALLPSLIVREHVAIGALESVLPRTRMYETSSLFMVHRRGDTAGSSPAVDGFRAFATRWLSMTPSRRGAPYDVPR